MMNPFGTTRVISEGNRIIGPFLKNVLRSCAIGKDGKMNQRSILPHG